MSMLAERKRKQKWSLNPRGKDWSEDSNKFGQKMLEKMGWSQGKGLGARENGITEHIKLAYKNDSKGMGYKEQTEQWTEHEDNFAVLLENLTKTVNGNTKTNTSELKLASLEVKSQSSKARLHYHKFTRGKDLTRYSEKDLANIFGKKTLNVKQESQEQEQDTKTEDDVGKSKHGVYTFNAGSMVDYFKSKLPNFARSNGYTIGNNGVLTTNNENEDSASEEKKKKRKIKETEEEIVENECQTPMKKKKKSKSESFAMDNPNFSVADDCHVNNEFANDMYEVKRKQKKISNSKTSENGLENPCFDLNASTLQDAVELDSFEVTRKSKKAKKTKNAEEYFNNSEIRASNLNVSDCVDNESNDIGAESFEVKRKSKKLKKSNDNQKGLDNPCLSLNNSNSTDNENETVNSAIETVGNSFEVRRKTKKLKKNKNNENGIDNPSLNLDNSCSVDNENEITNSEVEATTSFEVKRKSKKLKKSKDMHDGLDNPCLSLNNSDAVENENTTNNSQNNTTTDNYEIKRKSKKLNKNNNRENGLDNPCLSLNNLDCIEDENTTNNSQNNTTDNYEIKRKSKKLNKNRGTENGLDNPCLSLNNLDYIEDENTTNNSQNNTTDNYEIKRKSKKLNKNKGTENGLDNPCLSLNNSDAIENENTTNNSQIDTTDNYEVKRKSKKTKDNKKGIENPCLNLNDSQTEIASKLTEKTNSNLGVNSPVLTQTCDTDLNCDIMLNITNTPIKPALKTNATIKNKPARRRKSVHFSETNQEHIIPNKEDIGIRNELYDINTAIITKSIAEQSKKTGVVQDTSFDIKSVDKINFCDTKNGIKNEAFDAAAVNVQENIAEIEKTIDKFQAEVENDINEKKMKKTYEDVLRPVGEIGSDGENEKLEDGTKLRFKYANLSKRVPAWANKRTEPTAKKTYKHLIRGDVIVAFKNTNLHEIGGYAHGKISRQDMEIEAMQRNFRR